jgi:hypothetical protein
MEKKVVILEGKVVSWRKGGHLEMKGAILDLEKMMVIGPDTSTTWYDAI